jgi:enoyl-CoA hydratase
VSVSGFDTISVQRGADLVTVSLERLTMPPQMFRELGSLFRSFSADRALRGVVLRSAVQHFTYGLDPTAVFSQDGAELADAISAVAACPAPVLAAVHGRCMGSGVDLIRACDIRLASVDAKFSGALPALQGRDSEISAARAQLLGLVNDVYADRSALDAAAEAVAREISEKPPRAAASRQIMQCLRHLTPMRSGPPV